MWDYNKIISDLNECGFVPPANYFNQSISHNMIFITLEEADARAMQIEDKWVAHMNYGGMKPPNYVSWLLDWMYNVDKGMYYAGMLVSPKNHDDPMRLFCFLTERVSVKK